VSVAAIISGIFAIAKVFPIIDFWIQNLIIMYVNSRIDKMSAEDRAAIKTAIEKQDQRDLEKVIGNPNPGEPSGIPGTVLKDKLPGVKP
jgi:hypothetical protein